MDTVRAGLLPNVLGNNTALEAAIATDAVRTSRFFLCAE